MARRRPRRIAALGLLCLQLVLSVLTVVADARPLAGGTLTIFQERSAQDPVEQVAGPHICPFCTYLAAHQADAPTPAVTPRTSIVLPAAVELSDHAPPPITPVISVHTSRAPPAH